MFCWIRLSLVLLLVTVFSSTQAKVISSPVTPVTPANEQHLSRVGTGTENWIINGEDAARGQFPYQIGMFMDFRSFCGGSIISREWILTAAHCVDQRQMFTIFLGALHMNLPSEEGRITLNSRTAHRHEEYDRANLDNDVGLVKLPIQIQPDGHIGIIPLPPRSFNERDFVGQQVRVSGWGKLSDASSWISDRLQSVNLTVISNDKCKQIFGNIISDKIVCAEGPNGKSTCHGDSGGPLVVMETPSNRTVHFAVVSFVSSMGCSFGHPSGYDRTYKFLDWINEKTGIPIEN